MPTCAATARGCWPCAGIWRLRQRHQASVTGAEGRPPGPQLRGPGVSHPRPGAAGGGSCAVRGPGLTRFQEQGRQRPKVDRPTWHAGGCRAMPTRILPGPAPAGGTPGARAAPRDPAEVGRGGNSKPLAGASGKAAVSRRVARQESGPEASPAPQGGVPLASPCRSRLKAGPTCSAPGRGAGDTGCMAAGSVVACSLRTGSGTLPEGSIPCLSRVLPSPGVTKTSRPRAAASLKARSRNSSGQVMTKEPHFSVARRMAARSDSSDR
jgi:hypothetical protein